MENRLKQSNQKILFVVTAKTEQILEEVRKELDGIEQGESLFLLCSENTGVASERLLKEALDQLPNLGLIIWVKSGKGEGTGWGGTRLLEKIEKEYGVPSVVLSEHSAQKNFVRLRECSLLNREWIQETHFYRMVRHFLRFVNDITRDTSFMNLDCEDLIWVLKNKGNLHMSISSVKGTNSTERLNKISSVELLPSEILDTTRNVLLLIRGCPDLGLEEVEAVAEFVQMKLHPDTLLIFGAVCDEGLEEELCVEILAAEADM